MNPTPPILFHYSCQHGRRGIQATGVLRPNRHPWLPEPLVWLTDLSIPIRAALGLTTQILSCDRTTHRFQVAATPAVHWWPHYTAGAAIRPLLVRQLEGTRGAEPAHWWVSTEPLPVIVEPAGMPT